MWKRYLKQGWIYSKSLKNINIQVQNAVDVKRIVTRLALFQLSEGQSRSWNGSHKQLTTVERCCCDHRWAVKLRSYIFGSFQQIRLLDFEFFLT